MQRSKSGYTLQVEYRIVCSGVGPTHTFHAYSKSTSVKAQEAVDKNNADPIFVDPVPGNRGCLPWYIEARTITPWRSMTEPARRINS